MEIRIPTSNQIESSISTSRFSNLITTGNAYDTTFILQYQDIYGFFLPPTNTGANFVLSSLSNVTDTYSFVLGDPRTYTITITFNDDAREYSIDNILLRTSETSSSETFTRGGGCGIIPSNDHTNPAGIASNGDTKSFTVPIPNITPTATFNMGFQWTIYDDLQRYYQHVISTTEDLNQPSGYVQQIRHISGSSRKYNIVISGLKDAKGTNATTGSLTGFTATNATSNGLVISNPSISGGGITDGVFQAVDTVDRRRYDISGRFTDEYGFFKQIETVTTIIPSFNTPTISRTSLRTYTIAITPSGTLSMFKWKLSSVDEARPGYNTHTYTFLETDTGSISCDVNISNDKGFNQPSSNYGSVDIPTSNYRAASSTTFSITGSNTFIASLTIGSSDYDYTGSWTPSEVNIFRYRIRGILSTDSTDTYTDTSSNFHNYKNFQLKLKTYNPEGFISSNDNKTITFTPTNPQAVQTTTNSAAYFEPTITITDPGTNGNPEITPTKYQIKYKLQTAATYSTYVDFESGNTLTLSHSSAYYYKIKKVVTTDYGYDDAESSNFSVTTSSPVLPLAPTIVSMTVTESTISVTFSANSNGTPSMTPTYSLFYGQSGTYTQIQIGVSSLSFTDQLYVRQSGDEIKVEKVIHPDFAVYGFSNNSVTKTLNFNEPRRSIAHTTTHFRRYTKIVFTTSSTGPPADSSYTFSFEDGSSQVASITYRSNSAAHNGVGELYNYLGQIDGRTIYPWTDNRSEVFTETSSYLLYTTLSAASVTATNIQLRSVFGIANTTSNDVTYTYNNVTVDSNIKGFAELGQIELSNDTNYITKVRVNNIYGDGTFYFRNSLRDDVRNNIVINKSDTYTTASTEIIEIDYVYYVYINGLEPGRFTGRNYSCAYSNGSFTSPDSNFTNIDIPLAPQPTLTITKSDNNLHFTTKIRGTANYYPTDALIYRAAVIYGIDVFTTGDTVLLADTESNNFNLSFVQYDSVQTFELSNMNVGTYSNMCMRLYYSTPVNRVRTAPRSDVTIDAPTAPNFAVSNVDTTTLGTLKFAYNHFTSNDHGDFTSLFTGYTVGIDLDGDSTYEFSDSVTAAGEEAILSGLTNNTSYTVVYSKTYDNTSANNVIASLSVSTRQFFSASNPTDLTLTSITRGLDSLQWTLGSVVYEHNDSGYPALFAWGIQAPSAVARTWGVPMVWTDSNLVKAASESSLSQSTTYTIYFSIIYSGYWLDSSTTLSTLTPPTAPTYPLANVVRGITNLTFNVDSFTAKSHGDYSGVFTGYYVFISDDDTKYAQGSTGNLVITGLNIDTSYTVKFYKKYNTNDFDNFASAYVNDLNVRALLIPSLLIDRFNVDMSLHLNLYPWSNVHSSSRDSGDIVQIIPISWEIWSRSVANGAETLLSDSSTLYWVGERTVPFGTYYLRRITYTINGVIFNALVQTYILSGSSTGYFKASYKLKYSDGNTSEVFYRTIPIPHTRRYTDFTNIAAI
jgi:hypothetical protein